MGFSAKEVTLRGTRVRISYLPLIHERKRMNEEFGLQINWNNLLESLEYITRHYIETGERLQVTVNLIYENSKVSQPFTIECKIVEKDFKENVKG